MADSVRRDVLPIPDPQHVGVTTYEAKDPATKFPPITPLRPPEGAPNVLVILIDDVGFAASTAFGAPATRRTSSAWPLMGSSTRASTRRPCALRRAPRSSLDATTTRSAWAASPRSPRRPPATPPFGPRTWRRWQRLSSSTATRRRSSASATKCPCGRRARWVPFDAWPTGSGFEHFYGFIGGETNQYAPAVYHDTVPVEPDITPGEDYHFTEDMTDRTIEWIRQQKALMPDKPFFVYYAPGATHAPHHVRPEWSDRYKGKFDDGWDAQRERSVCAPEGDRRDPRRCRADCPAGGDPGLG